MEAGPDPQVRDFPVACDWCGAMLVGQIRREQVGQMVLVSVPHTNREDQPCKGSGRGIPVWSVRLELRAVASGFELRIGGGRPVACPNRETLIAKLRDFGVERDEAEWRVASVEAGKPVEFDVPERRRQPRSLGEGEK